MLHMLQMQNAIALRLNFHVNRIRRYSRIVPFLRPLPLGPGRLGFASPIRLPSTQFGPVLSAPFVSPWPISAARASAGTAYGCLDTAASLPQSVPL